jgi:sn-glycerol 3-phosphate transport system ATP-binding protein
MVFQSYALFPHLTVADNITFGLSVRKVAKTDQADRLKRVADLLGLAALLDRKPGQLSGGQQQRVALGRALIAETPLCLMDEPLSNLDAQLRQDMRREIRALQQRLGITMLYVTHDQVEAMSMADQVILMKGGRIEQDAPPAELYRRPATLFAARFIGTPPMNLIDLTQDGTLAGHPLAAGADLVLGIRPEDIRAVATGGLPATVQSVEFTGADTLASCRLGEAELTVRLPGDQRFAPGAPIRLGWDPAALHFFDKTSGRRRDDVTPVPSPAYALT